MTAQEALERALTAQKIRHEEDRQRIQEVAESWKARKTEVHTKLLPVIYQNIKDVIASTADTGRTSCRYDVVVSEEFDDFLFEVIGNIRGKFESLGYKITNASILHRFVDLDWSTPRNDTETVKVDRTSTTIKR